MLTSLASDVHVSDDLGVQIVVNVFGGGCFSVLSHQIEQSANFLGIVGVLRQVPLDTCITFDNFT